MGSEDYFVYVYEMVGGLVDCLDVIFVGKFDNGLIYYYCVSLKNSKGEKLVFKRNYFYMLNLVCVEGGGYFMMDEVIVVFLGSSGIFCNVMVVDDLYEIIGNGVYYLGLMNFFYVFYMDEEQKDVMVCVIGINVYSCLGSMVILGVVSMLFGIVGVIFKIILIFVDLIVIKLDFVKGVQGEMIFDVQVGGLCREIKLKVVGMGVFGNYVLGF